MNEKKLLRYVLPEGKGDIDIGGYNNKFLCIIESKYWDAPKIAALESELQKFEKTIEYISTHLDSLGFCSALKIIPIFYTPYLPYAHWGDIALFPSFIHLTHFLSIQFGTKQFKLLDNFEKISTFLENDREERALPLDLSFIYPDIPENTFRVHDTRALLGFEMDGHFLTIT